MAHVTRAPAGKSAVWFQLLKGGWTGTKEDGEGFLHREKSQHSPLDHSSLPLGLFRSLPILYTAVHCLERKPQMLFVVGNIPSADTLGW